MCRWIHFALLRRGKNVNEPLWPSHPSSEFRSTHVKWIRTSLLFTHTLQSPSLFHRYFSASTSRLHIELCCFLNLGPGWVSSNSIHIHFTTWDFHKRHNGKGRQEESSEGFSSPPLRWKYVLWNGEIKHAVEGVHNKTQFLGLPWWSSG